MLNFVECAEPPGAQVGLTSANDLTTVALVIPGWSAAGTVAFLNQQADDLSDRLAEMLEAMQSGEPARASVANRDGCRLVLTFTPAEFAHLELTVYQLGVEAGTVRLTVEQSEELVRALHALRSP